MSIGKDIGTLGLVGLLTVTGIVGCGGDNKKATQRVTTPPRIPSWVGNINGYDVTLYKSNNPGQPDRMEVVQPDGVTWIYEDRDFDRNVDRLERRYESATMFVESRDQNNDLAKQGLVNAATARYQEFSGAINSMSISEIQAQGSEETGAQ